MNKKNAALILIGILLLACGTYFFFAEESPPIPSPEALPDLSAAGQEVPPFPEEGLETEDRAEAPHTEKQPAAAAYHPKDIEEIKKQIYDLEIEYVEDIPLLDSVVQTGNAPTKDFWKGGWTSVDDSKEEFNGFKLEPQDDGTFIFYPDEATSRTYTFFETPKTYTYNPEKKEFFWEIDYYGKTISHRARFINDNVVAMMLISGRKVALDIYQKQPEKNE